MSLRVVSLVLFAVVLVGGAGVDVNNPPTFSHNEAVPQSLFPDLFGKRIEDVLNRIAQKRRDARRPVAFIGEHGYPVEEHKVTTPDGYILTLFRIPHGKKNSTSGERKEPVLIQHGLMSSAMDFLVTGPERALGFVLADAGYDVWLGNTRGSTYSRAHRDLDPDRKQFWQFSWHEIGERDLPTEINFILGKTGYAKLHYVGHSQGTTAYFVMCALRPMMQQKVHTMNALAPIAYMSNLYSPFVRFIAPFSDAIANFYNFSTTGEFMARNDLMSRAGYELCRTQSRFNEMCANMIYLAGGWGSDQLDPTQISDILSYSPASSSIFQLAHYGQGVVSGKFAQYNFGVQNNQQRYYTPAPPSYDPSKITSRVALHYADNDWLAAVVDVDKLATKIENLVGKYRVPDSKFNHMDFAWGKDAKRYVYDKVIGVMRRYAIPSQYYRGYQDNYSLRPQGQINWNGNNDDDDDNNEDGERNKQYTAGWGINV